MNQLNQMIIEGRLVKEPEVKELENGNKVANFTIANNKHFKDSDGKTQDEVTYMDVTAWNENTEFASKLQKGNSVRIVGRLNQNTWKSEDGKNHSKIFLTAEHIEYASDRLNKQINQAILEGNLVEKPDFKEFDSGKQKASFTIANNRSFKNPDGTVRNSVDFIEGEAWGPLAKKIKNSEKGNNIRIIANAKQDKWVDQDGINHSKIKLVTEQIELRSRKQEQAVTTEKPKKNSKSKEDDLGYGRF